MEKLKYAQDLIKTNNRLVMGGFNTFINGGNESRRADYGDLSEHNAISQGYDYAKEMAIENGIAFKYRFKCGENSDCFPFEYGGFLVCNACGRKGVDKDWWNIKVEKDGNEFCCHGLDFANLQESDNYAFGKTFEEAIKKYGELMINQSN